MLCWCWSKACCREIESMRRQKVAFMILGFALEARIQKRTSLHMRDITKACVVAERWNPWGSNGWPWPWVSWWCWRWQPRKWTLSAAWAPWHPATPQWPVRTRRNRQEGRAGPVARPCELPTRHACAANSSKGHTPRTWSGMPLPCPACANATTSEATDVEVCTF